MADEEITAPTTIASIPEALVDAILWVGDARARARAISISRAWRAVATRNERWRDLYEARWFHRPAADSWCRAYAKRVHLDRRCLSLLASWAKDAPLEERCTAAAELEALARSSDAAELREPIARVGGLMRERSCSEHFFSDREATMTPDPFERRPSLDNGGRDELFATLENVRKEGAEPNSYWLAFADPGAFATLRDAMRKRDAQAAAADGGEPDLAAANGIRPDQRVGRAAAAALAQAQATYVTTAYPDPAESLEDALFRVADCAQVFFDQAMVEIDLEVAAQAAMRRAAGGGEAALVRAAMEVLFDDRSLRGNTDGYYDPRNSFVDHVLRRKKGIPISLACTFVAVAERAGVARGRLRPVSAPGHFLLNYAGLDGEIFVDAFARHRGVEAGVLTRQQVEEFLERHNAVDPNAAATMLRAAVSGAATPDDVGGRCVRNLAAIAFNDEKPALQIVYGALGETFAPRGPSREAYIAKINACITRVKAKLALGDQRLLNLDHPPPVDSPRVLLLAAGLRDDVDELNGIKDTLSQRDRMNITQLVTLAEAHLRASSQGGAGVGIHAPGRTR